MNRLTGRATSWSVLLHAAIVALLVVRGTYEASEPSRLTIIDAELLLSGARSAAPGPRTENAAPAPEPDQAPAADPAIADIAEGRAEAHAEPVADEPPVPDPALARAEREATEPAAVPQASPEREASPPAAPASPISASEAPAELPTTETRAADAVETPPADLADPTADGAAAADERDSAAEPAVATADVRPSLPIPAREHAMLEKRFAAWTGALDGERAERSVTFKNDGREYTAVFRKLPGAGAMGMEHMVIEISTEQNGSRMSTELKMARLAFSHFAQFVDQWDPNVMIHDDQIDGRFHSNTEINVTALGKIAPLFNGKVTIASREINSDGLWRARRDRIFPAGLETGVRRILLPSDLEPLAADLDAEQVHRFARDARITFYPDGTYGWQYLESAEPEELRRIDERSHYLVGADDAALHVKGVVNGRVLVYTPETIVIENDLVYAEDPRAGHSDDFLGLVAERSVEIAPPNVTGPGDLSLHASIYARRQFAVRNYRSKASGTLSIYGSLTAGSLTATEPRYATHVQFDERLASARPPSFPLSNRYELESWDREWRVEPLLPAHDGTFADEPAEQP